MKNLSILFAYRNRDLKRIHQSMESLKNQTDSNFEVIFVDYGSAPAFSEPLQQLLKSYSFVKYFYVAHPGLLWNKSKAFNFGIKEAETPYIFTADVDFIFHPYCVKKINDLASEENFYLFKLSYLGKEESENLPITVNVERLKVERYGIINGMVLASKNAFAAINGFDEFFHFYGAEDEDLFSRMENAGYKKVFVDDNLFFHIWHRSFSISEDKSLTVKPRVKNIMRINQHHFLRNVERGTIKPESQNSWGVLRSIEEGEALQNPDFEIKLKNIVAHVEHFLNEELNLYKGKVVRVKFEEEPYYHSLKYVVKKILGRQTQPYCSLKEINDMVLKQILYRYRNFNYSFEVAENLKSIIFCIALKR